MSQFDKLPPDVMRRVLEMADPPKAKLSPAQEKERQRFEKGKPRKAQEKNKGRDLVFDAGCAAHGVPVPISEYAFAPPRRWRFDFCWPDYDLFLEVQGGIFTQGRHVRGAAMLKEFEKLNAACARGWRALFCTPDQIKDGSIFPTIKAALEGDL